MAGIVITVGVDASRPEGRGAGQQPDGRAVGVDAKMQQMSAATTSATSKMAAGMQALSQATIRVVAPQGDLSKALIGTGQAAQAQLNQFQRLQQQYQQTTAASTKCG